MRNPKSGRYSTVPAKNTLRAFDSFGASLVKRGKSILKRYKKVASGTLIDSYHYKMIPKKDGMELQFGFGEASSYWRFVDEGVKGVGGQIGSGSSRGTNSPFSFKYDNPGGKLVAALDSWIRYKNIPLKEGMTQTGLAFAIGYSIKRRGLERTMFFTRPLEALYQKAQKRVAKAYADDFQNLLDKMDTVIATLKSDISKM